MTTIAPYRTSPALHVGPTREIMGQVLAMGRHGVRVGVVIGILFASATHGYAVGRIATALTDMEEWIHDSRKEMHEFFWASYDIEDTKKEEEKKEKEEEKKVEEEKPVEPEPEVQPQPQPQPDPKQPVVKNFTPRAVANNTPSTNTNPSQNDDPYASDTGPSNAGLSPADMTGMGADGWQAGNGGSGVSGPGNCKEGLNCKKGNAPPKSTGEPAPAGPPPKDLSRAAEVSGSKSWSCPFPAEADGAGKDSATVVLVVTVRADGSPEKVDIVSDPGTGFGREARRCALQKRYKAGLDREGKPTRKATLPITVRFTR